MTIGRRHARRQRYDLEATLWGWSRAAGDARSERRLQLLRACGECVMLRQVAQAEVLVVCEVVRAWRLAVSDIHMLQASEGFRRAEGRAEALFGLWVALQQSKRLAEMLLFWGTLSSSTVRSRRFLRSRLEAWRRQVLLVQGAVWASWSAVVRTWRMQRLATAAYHRHCVAVDISFLLGHWKTTVVAARLTLQSAMTRLTSRALLPRGMSESREFAAGPDVVRSSLAEGLFTTSRCKSIWIAWQSLGQRRAAVAKLARCLQGVHRRTAGQAFRGLLTGSYTRILHLSGDSRRLDYVMARLQSRVRVLLQAWQRLSRNHRMAARLLATRLQRAWESTGRGALCALKLHAKQRCRKAAMRSAGHLASLRDRAELHRAVQRWWGVTSGRARHLSLLAARRVSSAGDVLLLATMFWCFRTGTRESQQCRTAIDRAELLTESSRLKLELNTRERGHKLLETEVEVQYKEMKRLQQQNQIAKEKIREIAGLGLEPSEARKVATPARSSSPMLRGEQPQKRVSWDAGAKVRYLALPSPRGATPTSTATPTLQLAAAALAAAQRPIAPVRAVPGAGMGALAPPLAVSLPGGAQIGVTAFGGLSFGAAGRRPSEPVRALALGMPSEPVQATPPINVMPPEPVQAPASSSLPGRHWGRAPV